LLGKIHGEEHSETITAMNHLARPHSKRHSDGRFLDFTGRGGGGGTRRAGENGCRLPIALSRGFHTPGFPCF
jgi:hypothetical protein